MDEKIIVNGNLEEPTSIFFNPFVYEIIRTKGETPLHLADHIQILKDEYQRVFHHEPEIDEAVIETQIGRLIFSNNFHPSFSHYILLGITASNGHFLRGEGTLFSDKFSGTLSKPEGILIKDSTITTTRTSSQYYALKEFKTLHNQKVIVTLGHDNTITSFDGNTPIVILDRTICLPAGHKSVFVEAFLSCCKEQGRKVTEAPVTLDMFKQSREALFVDYRGIVNLSKCGETSFFNIVSSSIAKSIGKYF